MSHALATVLHRGRKAASNIVAACLASSRGSAMGNWSPRSRERLDGTWQGQLKTLLEMDGRKIRNSKFEIYVSPLPDHLLRPYELIKPLGGQ